MRGSIRPSDLVMFNRKVYLMVLCAGFVSLTWLMLSSLQQAPAAAGVLSAARMDGPKPLTGGATMDGFGSWSADGKQIAFMRGGQIWVMGADGGGARALTKGGDDWDLTPAWRPGAAEVAFVRVNIKQGTAHIYLLNLADGKARQVATEPQAIGHVAWEPKGKLLYYTTMHRLMRLDPATGETTQLLAVAPDWEMLAGGVAISPDGQKAIYGAGPRQAKGVKYDLWLVPLRKGAEPEQLTRAGAIMPAFDGTGERLIYRNPRQETGIYLMALKSHRTERILADGARMMYFHPVFSPDGRQVMVSQLMLEPATQKGQGAGHFTSAIYLHTLGGSGGD